MWWRRLCAAWATVPNALLTARSISNHIDEESGQKAFIYSS
jgi:hypothetical protein